MVGHCEITAKLFAMTKYFRRFLVQYCFNCGIWHHIFYFKKTLSVNIVAILHQRL